MTDVNYQYSGIQTSHDNKIIPELPEVFKQRDPDSFQVVRDISSQEIILAAQSIVKRQLQEYPILMSNIQLAKH